MFKRVTILFLAALLVGCSVASDKEKVTQEPSSSTERSTFDSINNYLLNQKYFSWRTKNDGKNFCAFYPLNKVNEEEVYLWVRCSEFTLENNKLHEESGVSVPVRLFRIKQNMRSGAVEFKHEIPRDGSLYSKDFEKIFPREIRNEMEEKKNFMLVNLNSELLEKVAKYFNVKSFSEIPPSFIQRCEIDSDCITPFNYLIRSSCPYSSQCIDGACEIVCELDSRNN